MNCAALPESLIESELFGHEKGSFTGAHESQPGQIELAHGGTLFLDEIGTLGLALQSKLLRVLEQHMVQRIGAKAPKKIDFRLITATNEDLEAAVRGGPLPRRPVLPDPRGAHLPASIAGTRRRRGAASGSFPSFLLPGQRTCRLNRLEPDVVEILEDYSWPGNVRELENLVQRLVLMVPGEIITAKHLPQQILYTSSAKQEVAADSGSGNLVRRGDGPDRNRLPGGGFAPYQTGKRWRRRLSADRPAKDEVFVPQVQLRSGQQVNN